MKYQKDIAGKAVYPKYPVVRVLFKYAPDRGNLDSFTGHEEIGRATGATVLYNGDTWVQVTSYKAWELTPKGVVYAPMSPTAVRYGWVQKSLVRFQASQKSVKLDGTGLVKELIEQDNILADRLNYLNSLAGKFEREGKNLTTFRRNFNPLIERLKNRQTKLKESGLVKVSADLNSMWNKLGLGVAPVVIALVGVVAGGASAVALYFIFKPDYDESTQDLEISENLEKALENLDPEAKEEVITDLEKQIDKAARSGHNSGFVKATLNSAFSFGLPLILAAGLGYMYIKAKRK